MFDRRLWRAAMARAASRHALLLTILFSAAAGVVTVAQAYLLSKIVTAVFLEGATRPALRADLLGLLLAVGARALLAGGAEVAAQHVATGVKEMLRNRLFGHLLALGPLHSQGEQSGELANTIVEGIEALEAYFNQYLPQLVLATLVPATILLFVFPLDLLSGLVLLLTAPLIPLFMVLIGKGAEQLTARQWTSLSLMSAHFNDVLRGLSTLRRLGRAEDQVENVARSGDRFRAVTMGVLRVAFLSALALELLSTLSVAVVAVAIGLRLLEGRIAFQDAFFILVIAPEFYLPLRMLGARFHAAMEGIEAADRIFALLDRPAPQPTANAGLDATETAPLGLEEVTVTYPGRETPALRSVSLALSPGETVALVGASGAGKTTIAHLLLRFLEPETGRIWAGDRPLAEIDADAWREQVAWVSQTPYLFHDTVAANIRLARPEATDAEVESAARRARAHAFIRALPAGYETVIGEEGSRLSGGQAQRLALARAFLKDAPLLILDEPTAHLDPGTEALLREATATLMAERTVLLIAHRLHTVAEADRIVVVEAGRVVQQGKHAALLREEGPYRRMVAGEPGNAGADEATAADGPGDSARLPAPAASGGKPPGSRTRSGGYGPLRRLLGLVAPFWARVALSVLLGALTVGSSIGLLATSAYLISAAALQPSIAEVSVAIVGVRFFGLTRGLFRYLERLVSHDLTFRLLARIRTWFYASLVPLAPARLQHFRGGDLLGRITGDVATLEDFYVRAVAPPLVAALTLGVMLLYLGSYHAGLAAAFFLLLAAAGAGLPLAIRLAARAPGRVLVAARAALHVRLADGLLGMADLLAFGQARRIQQEAGRLAGALAAAERHMGWIAGAHVGLVLLLSNGAMAAVLYLAIPLVTSGEMAGVHLAGVALATLAAFEAVQPLPLAAQSLERSNRAAARLFEIVDAEPAVSDPPRSRTIPAGTPALTVRDLSFHYLPGERAALAGVNFRLAPGRWLAVVGPSGAGKSTLADLLLRFWEYDGGDIFLGGESVRAYPQAAVRDLFGVIGQQTTLFNASIRDNLRLANPRADEAMLRAAVAQARLAGFVDELPAGYDTRVGERGLQLSGGQRQRLALARVLLREAPFLILDEPTSNLDPLTEKQLLDSILAHAQGKGVLLITHRLVGMERMDEILVLDRGRIVERGSHAALLAAGGLYRTLWALQQSHLA